ncbi:MAG TPA: tetratricopeptide repeat protein [Gaiellaceae bacterium]|nr:tetratricopeptide repeat protein [Gaiellaceae bacterium]
MTFDKAHLDEIETVRQPGGVGWKPVRAELGISAFGVNVWTAERAGDEVIGPHLEIDEQAGGHEEAYLVLSGSATFRIGGEETEAPEGTLVAIHDPAVERGARASQDATAILAIGGRLGGPFAVAAWEWLARAAARAQEGDLAGAADVLREGLTAHPGSSTTLYNLACYEAMVGAHDAAVEHLTHAIALRADLRTLAAKDPDLASLRGSSACERLLAEA